MKKEGRKMYSGVIVGLSIVGVVVGFIWKMEVHQAKLEKNQHKIISKVALEQKQIQEMSKEFEGAKKTTEGKKPPHFTNLDGTIPVGGDVLYDPNTNLVWPRDGKDPGPTVCSPGKRKTWRNSIEYVYCLNRNKHLGYTDWRLPSLGELESLINYRDDRNGPWLKGQGFTNVQRDFYWSSTTGDERDSYAFYVSLWRGARSYYLKTDLAYVWPVRNAK